MLVGSPLQFNLDIGLKHLREQKLVKSGRQSIITKCLSSQQHSVHKGGRGGDSCKYAGILFNFSGR